MQYTVRIYIKGDFYLWNSSRSWRETHKMELSEGPVVPGHIPLALKDMYAQGLQSEQATRNILLNPADEKAAKNYAQAMEDFDKAYAVVVAKGADLPQEKGEIEQVMAVWKQAAALRTQVQGLARGGKKDEALTLGAR